MIVKEKIDNRYDLLYRYRSAEKDTNSFLQIVWINILQRVDIFHQTRGIYAIIGNQTVVVVITVAVVVSIIVIIIVIVGIAVVICIDVVEIGYLQLLNLLALLLVLFFQQFHLLPQFRIFLLLSIERLR